ncbi:MAG: glycoside hydrolase family 95 protein [Desulfobacterales bacterium]|nr:glycoside hydrolase family 95 protein [Desulfobacterales bacterium]
MIAGNIKSDTLVINEETLWSGGIHDYSNPEAFEHLDKIRQLILDEKYDEALEVGDKHMIGIPRRQQFYQPLGNLILNFEHEGEITDYKRSLNLEDAIVTISYKCDGSAYKREIFASHPDDAIIMRFTTDNANGLNLKLEHTSQHKSTSVLDGNTYRLSGMGNEGRGIAPDIRFESCINIKKGKGSALKNGFEISGQKEVILVYTAATNYINFKDISGNPKKICADIISNIETKIYKALLDTHVADYSSLFNRVDVDFSNHEVPQIPTDELIELVRSDTVVPYLDELFYQMARYLTIAGSRKGTQPLNLQGIWNDDMAPPWDCKWTLNINLPMNYWLAEAGNLADCHEPLFSLLYDLKETGAKVARTHYGCRGFVAHHNTDIWRGAAPVDGANWGLWTFGGAWLTRHLWDHYQYSQDIDFLKKAYPYMKEASLFFFDFLSKGNDKYLVTSPTVSFEQSYTLPDGRHGRLCEGPTMDNQMLRDLFSNCLRAAMILKDDKVYQDSLVLISESLRPTTIDKETGQLMEWAWPAFPRNVSGQLAPLWAVNPGTEINHFDTPELAKAAEATINARDPYIASYETSGSWVSGTRTNFWARLGRGDKAYEAYNLMINENLFPNMLASFYPKKYFMIDANLGVAAAFNEMLLQSHRVDENGTTIIDLLPALPAEWKNGYIKGIRSRGGFELNLNWEDGELKNVEIYSEKGNSCRLFYKEQEKDITLKPEEEVKWVVPG